MKVDDKYLKYDGADPKTTKAVRLTQLEYAVGAALNVEEKQASRNNEEDHSNRKLRLYPLGTGINLGNKYDTLQNEGEEFEGVQKHYAEVPDRQSNYVN